MILTWKSINGIEGRGIHEGRHQGFDDDKHD